MYNKSDVNTDTTLKFQNKKITQIELRTKKCWGWWGKDPNHRQHSVLFSLTLEGPVTYRKLVMLRYL
jgi:hypothetical protein